VSRLLAVAVAWIAIDHTHALRLPARYSNGCH
jgi:hypothetical protein